MSIIVPIILIVLVPTTLVTLALTLWWMYLKGRQEDARVVVNLLAAIVGQNLPLHHALEAAAVGQRGRLRRIFIRAANYIAEGHTLTTAIRAAYPLCPGHISGAIAAAEADGTLPTVLRRKADEMRQLRAPTTRGDIIGPYMLIMFLAVPAVVSFVATFVLPKYQEIFYDFDVTMPTFTIFFLSLLNWTPALIPLCLLVVFMVPVHMVTQRFFTRKPHRFQPLLTVWDSVVWWLPLAGRVASARAMRRQLPVLQASLAAGHDLRAALRSAAEVGVNWHARERLRGWADAIEVGKSPGAAARALALPTPVIVTIEGAGDPAALIAGLDYLTTYYHRLWLYWERVTLSIAVPVVVTFWGLIVCGVAISMIQPLTVMIAAAAGEL